MLNSLHSKRSLTNSEHEHTNFQLLFSRKHSRESREKKSPTTILDTLPLKRAESYIERISSIQWYFHRMIERLWRTVACYRRRLEKDPVFQLLALGRWQGFYVQITWFMKWFIGKYISFWRDFEKLFSTKEIIDVNGSSVCGWLPKVKRFTKAFTPKVSK